MKRAREIIADVIKYSVIIGVFLFLEGTQPIKGLVGTLPGRIATAVISAALSLIVLDIVLGRPTLKATWFVGERPALGGRPELYKRRDGTLPEISVKYLLEGSGLLHFLAKKLASAGTAVAHLKFTPTRVVMAEQQYGKPHHEFSVEQDTLITSFLDGFTAEGSLPAAFIFLPVSTARPDFDIGCKFSWKSANKWENLALKLLVKPDAGIKGFHLKGE